MDDRSQAALADEESFEAIEQAVMETARGRWFLAEFAVRNRQAETVSLLKSLSRLERVIARSGPLDGSIEMRTKLIGLSGDIDTLVAALTGDVSNTKDGPQKLNEFVLTSEKTCIEMAVVADAARDIAARLVESNSENDAIAELDYQLTELVRLSSEQMTSMRQFEALAEIQRHVKSRLTDIIHSYGPLTLSETPLGPAANDQVDGDEGGDERNPALEQGA